MWTNTLAASCLTWLLASSVLARPVSLDQRAITGNLEIVPNGSWTAVNTGQVVSAHGEGIFQVGSTYYMVGEDKTGSSAFQNVNCYSSTDLVQWSFVNAVLSQQSSGDLGPNRVVERPKVIYNDANKQYVMYMHIDSSSYGEAKVGVATSSTPCGKYSYRGSFQPLGHQSRDMSLFKDPTTGTGYLLTEDRQNGLRIDQLSSDYLSVVSATYLFSTDLEAPAMIYQNGLYYIFGSYLTGWNNNNNVYATAKSLSGPWSSFANFAPANTNTFESQTAYILQTPNGVVYMGDRWNPNDFVSTSYIWLPMVINGAQVTMSNNYANWLPSTSGAGPSATTYRATSGTLSGGARTVSCSGCDSSTAVGYLGGPSGGSLTISGLSSSDTSQKTIRLTYENGDQTQRFAMVSVNGGKAQQISFIPTGGGDSTRVASFNTALNKSNSNTITISGLGDGTYGPDISLVSVPQF